MFTVPMAMSQILCLALLVPHNTPGLGAFSVLGAARKVKVLGESTCSQIVRKLLRSAQSPVFTLSMTNSFCTKQMANLQHFHPNLQIQTREARSGA